MTLLTRDQIWQSLSTLPTEDVEIRDPSGRLVGTVRMRGLTGAELDAYQASLVVQTGNGSQRANLRNASAKLVVMCAIDENGDPLFEPKDMLKVSQMPAYALQRLTAAAQRLCGLTNDDMRELVEDFGDAPNGSSTTG